MGGTFIDTKFILLLSLKIEENSVLDIIYLKEIEITTQSVSAVHCSY